MDIVASKTALGEVLRRWRTDGCSIAFVPTMGNLHDGHLRLVEEAKRLADRVVASIFVNPAQFSPGEDFGAYPRTPAEDAEKLRAAGTHLLFLPETGEIYPDRPEAMAFVEVPGLSDDLCGRFRPGHFRGVATIVCKLFNMVRPDVALFGEKDYQQLLVIRRMVADLDMPVRIHPVATVREPSGLALSSRNGYLTAEEKSLAAELFESLSAAAGRLRGGDRNFAEIERQQWAVLEAAGLRPDYFSIRRQADLALPQADDKHLVILAAARLGKTRLIDNLKVSVD
jgi:pantoate--beta-alanine ligase